MAERVAILGCGYVGREVARQARTRGQEVIATLRSHREDETLRSLGVQVVWGRDLPAVCRKHIGQHTDVVIAFPPDGATDAAVAGALASLRAASITYVSSTGVYGTRSGRIDDLTPTDLGSTPRIRLRLEAESGYRELGGTVLRAPGIYGPDRGAHVRLLAGKYRLPGDGSNAVSRIHVHDLAQLILAASSVPHETFVVGDLNPAPHIEVARFLVEAFGVSMPPAVPLEEVHETLRGNRRVDPSRALSRLGVTLRYPSYREGMDPEAR